MGKDIPLGRIAGIKVGMDVTVFLIAAYLSVMLATTWLPHDQPGHGSTTYWIAGGAGAILFFVTLLVHELGHALVAQDEGIGVDSIGLNMLGGVTRMETSPTTPGAEFRVSVVGPVASAACGIVLLVGSFITPDRGVSGVIGSVFFLIGYFSLLLAAFNMIPATPLDGGKVLSAAIWRTTGDQSKASTWAGASGIVAGMAIATWGFRRLNDPAVGQRGWFLVLTGGFIAFAAFQQIRNAPLLRALDGVTVADSMAAHPPTAPSWATVGEFLRTSSPRPEHQAYPVVGPDGQVAGLLTAAAIRAVPPEAWDQMAVMALAYPLDRLTLIRDDELLLPALQKLESADVRTGLVVTADGRITGTLDPTALHRALAARPSVGATGRV
ncbi:site-2 protease family protein [Aquihabitans sp. McL0605]|uniref:site-2 protease family protein n=1 Tax=Aquihabitans sp. McL0605 TaxID=3415671 RepID=UPI003CEE8022